MLPANRALWELIDPWDVLRLEVANLETEAALAVFLVRLYARLDWDHPLWGMPRRPARVASRNERRESELTRELCQTVAMSQYPEPTDRERVYELTRELCESSDVWEALIGEKLYRYLIYFVDDMVIMDGLTREEAAERLAAVRAVFDNCTDGQMDPDSFFE